MNIDLLMKVCTTVGFTALYIFILAVVWHP